MTAVVTTRPVAEGLWRDTDDGLRLVGARCPECATVTFPMQDSCPRCTRQGMVEHLLAARGPLWSFTVQGFRPKPPYLDQDTPFAPYGVGYVDLGGEVLVEGRLTESDPAVLSIGAPMRLVVVPFHTEPDGTQVTVYAFAPDDEGASA